ncbi:MAG: anti-phage ZorAB system protein ZorA [Hyphomonadaceae bacterium]
MNALLDLLLSLLELLFGVRWVAPLVLAPLMALWSLIIWRQVSGSVKPFVSAADYRIGALTQALGDSREPMDERNAFSANYSAVAEALNQEKAGAEPLVSAWREFHETVIDETESPIRNTQRPSLYFARAAPKLTRLTFWSNVMVAGGLLLTFLGLIVALNVASKGMLNGATQADMQASLRELLTVAGAKFFTSVAGVGCSLMLRFAEHNLHKKITGRTETLCALLERGLLYAPPQRLAAEQLEVLREQRDQLKSFNTDFALQLSERMGAQFQQALLPVSSSLSQLNDNMVQMSSGLGQGAAKAVEEASGGELRALGQTLAALSERLAGLNSAVENSSDGASSKIRAAGEDFAQAAADIKTSFNRLLGDMDAAGERISRRGDEAARSQDEAFARSVAQLEEAQTRLAAAVEDAARNLNGAGSAAAQAMQNSLSETLKAGVAASSQTFGAAIEEAGAGLRQASGEIVQAITTASVQLNRSADRFVRSGESAERAGAAMSAVANHAQSTAAAMGAASQNLQTVATPIAQAARAASESAQRIQQSIEQRSATEAQTLQSLTAMADSIRQTHAAAEQAWTDYRTRFAEVDEALGKAMVLLGDSLGDSLSQFRGFASTVDEKLGAAVSKLSTSLSIIEEYAGNLDEYVDVMAKQLPEPAS